MQSTGSHLSVIVNTVVLSTTMFLGGAEGTGEMKSTEVQNPRRKMRIESWVDNVHFCADDLSMVPKDAVCVTVLGERGVAY